MTFFPGPVVQWRFVVIRKYRLSLFAIMLILVLLVTACGPTPQAVTGTDTPSASTATLPVETAFTVTPAPSATADMSGMGEVPTTGEYEYGNLPQIKVTDQVIDNGMITLEDVVSSGPGWVVIYTIDSNGQPDQPIGRTAVKDGDNRNVMIQIDTTQVQGTLEALLHLDQGQVGEFEFPGPDGPVMAGVQMVASLFHIVAPTVNNGGDSGGMTEMQPQATQAGTTPAIIVANQPIVDKTITLPEVIANDEAWVVIHKQNGDGTMGPMAGFAHVQAGVNRNVIVPLDTSLTSTVMYAMLHQDIAKQPSPVFPGTDAPVLVNGQMIAPTFEITSGANADVVINLGDTPTTANYLVDGEQMSLYISLQDTPGKSNCTGDCLGVWHPLIATGRIIAGTGVPSNNVGVLLLPDGSRQVTYLNAPLYLYSKDEKPGDVNGQGVDGNWYLVVP